MCIDFFIVARFTSFRHHMKICQQFLFFFRKQTKIKQKSRLVFEHYFFLIIAAQQERCYKSFPSYL